MSKIQQNQFQQRPLRRPVVFAIAAFLFAACGGAPEVQETQDLNSRALFPLAPGYVWSYNVVTGVGPDALAITRVVRAEGTHFEVQNDGGDPIHYDVREDGIFRSQSETYLLRDPIAVGQEWQAAAGRTARVRSTGEQVETNAGNFSDCVIIEETGGNDNRTIETTYCPNVGPVIIRAVMTSNIGGRSIEVNASLIGHGEAM